jgi:prepilin-type N-terminal cleavage/methylation domain-containing protein
MTLLTRGSSLIEVMVAILLFSVVGTAVAQTVVLTQRARQVSENWMCATQLASQQIEAVRAGSASEGTGQIGIFRRETTTEPVTNHRGLVRVDVTVSWTDTDPKEFTLSTLVRQ